MCLMNATMANPAKTQVNGASPAPSASAAMRRANPGESFEIGTPSPRQSVSETNEYSGVENCSHVWNADEAQLPRADTEADTDLVKKYFKEEETDLNELMTLTGNIVKKHQQGKIDAKRQVDSLTGRIRTQQMTIAKERGKNAELKTSKEISSKSWMTKKLEKYPKLGTFISVCKLAFSASAIGLGTYTAVGAIGAIINNGAILAAGGLAAAGPIGWAILGIAVGLVGIWGIKCCIKKIWDYQKIHQATKAAERAANHA